MLLELLTISAILLSPFLAVFAQSRIDAHIEARARKLGIYKTLMATRGEMLSRNHVEALNRIDIEFDPKKSRKEKAVIDAWTVHLDHFANWPQPPTPPTDTSDEKALAEYRRAQERYTQAVERAMETSIDNLATLLSAMGECFGYHFDKVRIKKAAYRPQAYVNLERQQEALLLSANDVLSGRRPLAMHVVNWPEQTEEQKLLAEAFVRSVTSDGAYRVRLVTQPDEKVQSQSLDAHQSS